MKKLVMVLILNLSISFSVSAETSLWKVQLPASPVYIGGTIHVLRQSDYPLPIEFTQAYKDSDVIVFETDIDKLNTPEIQNMIATRGIYRDNMSLDKVLSSQAYNLLKDYCESSGIPVLPLNKLKPPLVILTLLSLELQKLGVNLTGVDIYFHSKATADGKKVEWLESVREQMDFVLTMGKGNENDFIKHSIRELKKTKEIIDDLIAAWRQGNEGEIYTLFVAPMKKDYPSIYETLLAERNREWLSKIERYIVSPQTEFVLVGVGHLVGADGIIQHLRNLGYRVKKLN